MTTAVNEKEALKAEQNAKREADAAEEKRLNEGRTGKGTRAMIGYTRGKGSQRITYEAFDETQPDTLPATLSEFMELTKTNDEKVIVSYLVDGFNSAQYTAASDPVAEFVNPQWDEKLQTQFRLTVRNFAASTNMSIEDAAAIIRPNVDKAFAAKSAPVA